MAIFVRGKVVAQGAPSELARSGAGPEEVEFITNSGDAKVRSTLDGATFVKGLVPSRGLGGYVVSIDRGSTNQLITALVNGGVQIDGVRRTSDDLDEVYRRYFQQDEVSRV